jgi:hypothetical protein
MSYPLALLAGAVSNVPESSAADESVSLLELLVPLCGWAVLTVGICVRFRRQPRNISA